VPDFRVPKSLGKSKNTRKLRKFLQILKDAGLEKILTHLKNESFKRTNREFRNKAR
jgi:tRNA G26 N,N-dimethylase Trm1